MGGREAAHDGTILALRDEEAGEFCWDTLLYSHGLSTGLVRLVYYLPEMFNVLSVSYGFDHQGHLGGIFNWEIH